MLQIYAITKNYTLYKAVECVIKTSAFIIFPKFLIFFLVAAGALMLIPNQYLQVTDLLNKLNKKSRLTENVHHHISILLSNNMPKGDVVTWKSVLLLIKPYLKIFKLALEF